MQSLHLMEPLPCNNEWLIDDVCLLNGCWIYKECDLCLVEDIEVVIDWFSAMMWGAIKMSNSPIGGTSEFPCLPKSVDQAMCQTGTLFHK